MSADFACYGRSLVEFELKVVITCVLIVQTFLFVAIEIQIKNVM